MQVYGRGLRRRLPPMLDGDPRRIRMVYSLLFSLPGTPVLFYGEEIGMGEDLDAEGRLAVRTPMQWTSGRNGGFSTAPPRQLPGPVVSGGFSPEFVNVADQRHDPDSLLSFMKLLISRYRESPELGWGTFTVLEQPHPSVLAHACVWDDGTMVAVHNLGRRAAHRAADAGGLRLHAPAGGPAPGGQHAGLRQGRGGARAGGLRLPLAAGGRPRTAAGWSEEPPWAMEAPQEPQVRPPAPSRPPPAPARGPGPRGRR